MIALMDINGKGFSIKAGKPITEEMAKLLDIEALKKAGAIGSENKEPEKVEKNEKEKK